MVKTLKTTSVTGGRLLPCPLRALPPPWLPSSVLHTTEDEEASACHSRAPGSCPSFCSRRRSPKL